MSSQFFQVERKKQKPKKKKAKHKNMLLEKILIFDDFVQIQKASGAHWSILLFRGACSCVPLSSIIDLAQTG